MISTTEEQGKTSNHTIIQMNLKIIHPLLSNLKMLSLISNNFLNFLELFY